MKPGRPIARHAIWERPFKVSIDILSLRMETEERKVSCTRWVTVQVVHQAIKRSWNITDQPYSQVELLAFNMGLSNPQLVSKSKRSRDSATKPQRPTRFQRGWQLNSSTCPNNIMGQNRCLSLKALIRSNNGYCFMSQYCTYLFLFWVGGWVGGWSSHYGLEQRWGLYYYETWG